MHILSRAAYMPAFNLAFTFGAIVVAVLLYNCICDGLFYATPCSCFSPSLSFLLHLSSFPILFWLQLSAISKQYIDAHQLAIEGIGDSVDLSLAAM